MKEQEIFVSDVCVWAPGIETAEELQLWKEGKNQILEQKILPKIEFTEPLFRRRLSQISRMTIQVVHDLTEKVPETASYKQVFVSFRGEIEREFTVNQSIIEDAEIMPAAFSLSVFNTPIALASIALKLKGGYSVIFPDGEDFSAGFKCACAPVLCGAEENIIFVYADEFVPDDYKTLRAVGGKNIPLAFAFIVGGKKTFGTVSVRLDSVKTSPIDFLKSII